MRYTSDPLWWDLQAELALSPTGVITAFEVMKMMGAAIAERSDCEALQQAQHNLQRAIRIAQGDMTTTGGAEAWRYHVEHFARDLESADAAARTAAEAQARQEAESKLKRDGPRERFSIKDVIAAAKKHGVSSVDELIERWELGDFNRLGKHELDLTYDEDFINEKGKPEPFRCYVGNPDSPFKFREMGWQETTIRKNFSC